MSDAFHRHPKGCSVERLTDGWTWSEIADQSMASGETEEHKHLKSLAARWAVEEGYRSVGYEISLPHCGYRADVAAYRRAWEVSPAPWEGGMRRQRQNILGSTAIFECKQSRADLFKDSCQSEQALEQLRRLQSRRQNIERLLKTHYPTAGLGDSLFQEYESFDFSQLGHVGLSRILEKIAVAQNSLLNNTKFEKLARYRCANLLYLVTPNHILKNYEIPLFWGLLVIEGDGLKLVQQPQWLESSESSRIGILQKIAEATTFSLVRKDVVLQSRNSQWRKPNTKPLMDRPAVWLNHSQLAALAPHDLVSYRVSRFRGEENPILLGDLHQKDQVILRRIYQILDEIFNRLRGIYQDPVQCLQVLRVFLNDQVNEELIVIAQSLGVASSEQNPGAHLKRIFHDLRGGALPALAMRLQLIAYPSSRPEDASQVFFLTRDHLKIMRNCIRDIDPPLRESDTQQQDHSLLLLSEKWAAAQLAGGESDLHVEVACHYDGVICESCLEFSTLDRIIYNMMNNAARYAADRTVQFTMLPWPTQEPESIRFVIANKVLPDQAETLRERFGDEIGNLLRGGFTTGGNGLGLRICADFCSQAYGVANFDTALSQGYFGAKLMGDIFLIWFHWPLQAE